jgi:Kef-type K+ transport system membrane component KefB
VVLATVGAAAVLHLSPLLASMIVGFVIVNLERRHRDFFAVTEQIEEPLFGLFFALAGAHMDMHVFRSAGLLAIAILLYRMLGKQFGTWLGARWTHAPRTVRRYLGLALFPQAGVAVGLVLLTREIFPDPVVANILVNAVIGSVIVNELIAPPLVRHVLLKARQDSGNVEEI